MFSELVFSFAAQYISGDIHLRDLLKQMYNESKHSIFPIDENVIIHLIILWSRLGEYYEKGFKRKKMPPSCCILTLLSLVLKVQYDDFEGHTVSFLRHYKAYDVHPPMSDSAIDSAIISTYACKEREILSNLNFKLFVGKCEYEHTANIIKRHEPFPSNPSFLPYEL